MNVNGTTGCASTTRSGTSVPLYRVLQTRDPPVSTVALARIEPEEQGNKDEEVRRWWHYCVINEEQNGPQRGPGKPTNNYYTTSRGGYCPNSVDTGTGRSRRGYARVRTRVGGCSRFADNGCAREVMWAWRSSMSTATMHHRMSAARKRLSPLSHHAPSIPPPPSTLAGVPLRGPFQLELSLDPSSERRPSSLPSSRRACGQIYGLARYNKQWRSNEPSLTVNYRFPSSIQAPRGTSENGARSSWHWCLIRRQFWVLPRHQLNR